MMYHHPKMSMRNYKKEYKNYHSKPEQKLRRAARNAARRSVKAPSDKDVHHKDGNPMNNNKSNLSVVSKNYNRKEPRLRENLYQGKDIKKAISKIKGLTKKQIQMLLTLPPSTIYTVVNQLSTLVAGDVQEFMKSVEEDMGTTTGAHIAGTGDDSSTVIVRKKKKILKRIKDIIDYNKKGGHNV